MATYKVPQDVEADDKLIGPFSFRQFVYLLIVAMAIAIAWGLSRIFIGLAIVPLPIVLLFGALALPLRKDQPMEIYLAAIVSFYLKPRFRTWDGEGIESLIEITAPKVVEVRRTKDLSQNEAAQRLNYLADIVDSGGWAIRGVNGATGTAMNRDFYLEAQGATDVLDTNTSVAQTFDHMMSQSAERVKEEARLRMLQAAAPEPVAQPQVQPTPVPQQYYQQPPQYQQPLTTPQAYAQQAVPSMPAYNPVVQQPAPIAQIQGVPTMPTPVAPPQAPAQPAVVPTPTPQPSVSAPTQASVSIPDESLEAPKFDPYPTFKQSIIQPIGDTEHHAESDIVAPVEESASKEQENDASTSSSTLSAGIMNLANNSDLSIETIAHEANRLKKKAEEASDEVVISLR